MYVTGITRNSHVITFDPTLAIPGTSIFKQVFLLIVQELVGALFSE